MNMSLSKSLISVNASRSKRYLRIDEIRLCYIFGRRKIGGLIEEKRHISERCWRVENESDDDDESWLV